MLTGGHVYINIEDISAFKWHFAMMILVKEKEDDFLFRYDVDQHPEHLKGKIRIDKSLFKEVRKRGLWDNLDIVPDDITDGLCDNRIGLIAQCSKPLNVYPELPEYDMWSEIMIEKYFNEYMKTGIMPAGVLIEREQDQITS